MTVGIAGQGVWEIVHVVSSTNETPVFWGSEESLSKRTSSPLSSCKNHVSIVPVASRTTQVAISVSPLREKWVHMLSLESVLRSNKSDWAAFGLIKR